MTDRAAAPGKQVVRVDNVKAKSWVDVKRDTGHLGQIFFATDNAELDNHDMSVLDIIVKEYPPKLNANTSKIFFFQYFGYADHRHTKEHNYNLSQKRADAVALYLSGYLSPHTNYAPEAKGLGVDYNGIGRPATSKDLEEYRRVDIFAEPIKDPPPAPVEPKERPPRSSDWQARMRASASVSVGPISGDVFGLEIVDLTNKLSMLFRYLGLGLGKSPGKAPMGGSGSASASGWCRFKVSPPVSIQDFEGFALHTAAQVQLGAGGSLDLVTLLGPHARRGANGVLLRFSDFTIFDKAAGIGASQTGGTLQPTKDNDGKPRPWSP